jgi:hypothetical protein
VPRTGYTDIEMNAMKQFNVIPNFVANSFTLYNKKNNLVIENAIRTDSNGNVIFKDRVTEIYLEKLIQTPKGMIEQISDDGEFTLFFQDKFNKKYSLGEIYYNLFASQAQNMSFWFGERASEYLDYGLDQHIIEDHMTIITETNIDDPTKRFELIDVNRDSWKNHWHTIPCLQVVVPDYVDGKFASISATISFKIKTNNPVATGFRIFDATTGLELTRVVHFAERNNGEFTHYTIPLNYQGPLPDTKIDKKTSFTGITYDDIANLEYKHGVEEGIEVIDNIKNYEIVPYTKHIIRLQWITCSMATEIDKAGQIIGDEGRYISIDGQTSLDVAVFDTKLNKNEITQLSGVIDTIGFEKGQTKTSFNFEVVPYGLEENYSISFTPNKNVRVSIEEKRINGFTISWNKYVEGLKIDWCVIYRKDETSEKETIDVDYLTNPNRPLNHYLFPNLEFSDDFCREIDLDEGYKYTISNISTNIITTIDYLPTPVCCEGCEAIPEVTFKLVPTTSNTINCNNNKNNSCHSDPYTIQDTFGVVGHTRDGKDVRFLVEFSNETTNCQVKFVESVIQDDLFQCVTDFTSSLNDGWGILAYDRYYYNAPSPENSLDDGISFVDGFPESCSPII